jgi:hypothetical protein
LCGRLSDLSVLVTPRSDGSSLGRGVPEPHHRTVCWRRPSSRQPVTASSRHHGVHAVRHQGSHGQILLRPLSLTVCDAAPPRSNPSRSPPTGLCNCPPAVRIQRVRPGSESLDFTVPITASVSHR